MLQNIGRHSHRDIRRQLLSGHVLSRFDTTGQATQQYTETVFCLGNGALVKRNSGSGDFSLNLGLVDIEFRNDAFVKTLLDNMKTINAGLKGFLGNCQPSMKIKQLIVTGYHISNQGQLNGFKPVFRSHQFRPGSLGGALKFAPEIYFPVQWSGQVNGGVGIWRSGSTTEVTLDSAGFDI